MKSTFRPLPWSLAAMLLATPLLASAQQAQCKFSEPRALKLDLAGITSVMFKVGSNTLKLKASPDAGHSLQGRACASSQALLEGLTSTQERHGDRLTVTLVEDRPLHFSLGSTYSYLDLTGTVPNNVLVQLDVGSGDASLSGAKAASADVGSGDVELRDIAGLVSAKVGSGDVNVQGAGALDVLSVGSGDVKGERIAGKVDVGSVGSGDLNIKGVGRGFSLKSMGSGDVDLSDVTGDVLIGSVGSGDLIVHGVQGNLTVHSRGSGDIDQHGVTGTINVPKEN